MAIITLITDYGTKDYFAAAIKGAILSENIETQIVDISHDVEPFNVYQTAYILKNAYKHFPKGSIHMIGVDSERTDENDHVAVFIDGHYFIGADNGVFSLMFPELNADKIVSLNIAQDDDHITFPMKDVFVRAAAHIARGGELSVMGRDKRLFLESGMLQPVVRADKSGIKAVIIYVDNFGNLVTNVSETLFKQVAAGRRFEIEMSRNFKVNTIALSYSEVKVEGKLMALFNSSGHLEIAINKGHVSQFGGASSLLGMGYRDFINIEFK